MHTPTLPTGSLSDCYPVKVILLHSEEKYVKNVARVIGISSGEEMHLLRPHGSNLPCDFASLLKLTSKNGGPFHPEQHLLTPDSVLDTALCTDSLLLFLG